LARIGTTFAVSRTLAQRFLWAAAIRARADADSFRVPVPFPYALPNAASAAPIPRSSLVRRSCSFFSNRTTPAKLDIEFPLGRDCNSAGTFIPSRPFVTSMSPAWLSEEYYGQRIQPRLRTVRIREISEAMHVSKPHAALIRAGRRRPHLRHWEALAQLVGVTAKSVQTL